MCSLFKIKSFEEFKTFVDETELTREQLEEFVQKTFIELYVIWDDDGPLNCLESQFNKFKYLLPNYYEFIKTSIENQKLIEGFCRFNEGFDKVLSILETLNKENYLPIW